MTPRPLDDVTVVVPTVGRASLHRLLDALVRQNPPIGRLVIVDDRRAPDDTLAVPEALRARTSILASAGRGPAAARNIGWRSAASPWIVFLDDDVVPEPSWSVDLGADLTVDAGVAASQARLSVPLPPGRRPTDRERNVARLATAEWITADLAVRRTALAGIGGFDERFPRAYREDSDLALRLEAAGWRLARGRRRAQHPVQPAPWWASVTAQRGNRDDALMRAIHGHSWRPDRGRRPIHAAVTAAGAAAAALAAAGRPGPARLAFAGWLLGTAEFAVRRIAGGPRQAREMASLVVTSVLIPPVAVAHWIAGWMANPARRTEPWPAPQRR